MTSNAKRHSQESTATVSALPLRLTDCIDRQVRTIICGLIHWRPLPHAQFHCVQMALGSKHQCICIQTSGLPRWFSGKESACQCRRCWFHPWVGKIPWTRKWQPTPVFLPGKSHRQRSLMGYSPWGHKRVRHDSATKQQQYG